MIVVIFEAFHSNDKWETCLDMAAALKSELSKIEGFISIERFQSLNNSEKVLSLSFWRDENSIQQWRNIELHRQAQVEGRKSIFENYRLRIASVSRDYGLNERKQAPNDSKLIHDKI